MVALTALAVGWLAYSLEVTRTRPVDLEAPQAPPAERAVAELEESPAAPGGERKEATREEPSSATASPGIGFTLLVVDQESEQPLAGAEVWLAELDVFESAVDSAGRFIQLDAERIAQELGQRRVTGTNGELRLPATAEYFYASGRAGELWGETRLQATKRDSKTLRLRQDHRIEIEVVDEVGQPCGEVAVALLSIDDDYRDFLWIGRTDAEEGRALIPHYQELVDGEEDSELFAVLAMPLMEPVRAPLAADPPPAEPVRLTLPTTGSVAIQVLNEEHRAPDGGVDVRVGVVSAGTGDSALDPKEWLRCENGRLLLTHVELGVELEIDARSDEGYQRVTTRVPGPMRPGQRVEVVLRFLDLHPILTGRLLDPAGLPFADRELFCEVILKDGFGSRGKRVRTDPEGRFRCVVDSTLTDQGACVLRFQPREEGLPLECVLDLPRVLPAGELELGDLQLEHLPIALAGRVVEGEDEPVAGAVCALRRKQFSDNGSDQYSWGRVDDAGGKTGTEGTFAITGEFEPGEYGLSVSARGFPHREPFPIRLGDQDVLIRLERGGAIAGSVLLDERIPSGHVLLSATREKGGGGTIQHIKFLGRDGLFLLENLHPGRWELLLQCGSNQAEPLLDPIPVEVISGKTVRPPSLQGIELRNRLHVLQLRVLDEDGRVLESTVLYGAAGDSKTPKVQKDSDEEEVVLVERWPAFDLLVTAPGRRDAWLEDVSGELEVVLRPALSVRLRLTRELELPDEQHQLIVRLRPELDGVSAQEYVRAHRDFISSRQPFQATIQEGEAELLLPTPGTWRLEWLVAHQRRHEPLAEEAQTLLEIRGVETTQELELAPPGRELVDEALRRLKE